MSNPKTEIDINLVFNAVQTILGTQIPQQSDQTLALFHAQKADTGNTIAAPSASAAAEAPARIKYDF